MCGINAICDGESKECFCTDGLQGDPMNGCLPPRCHTDILEMDRDQEECPPNLYQKFVETCQEPQAEATCSKPGCYEVERGRLLCYGLDIGGIAQTKPEGNSMICEEDQDCGTGRVCRDTICWSPCDEKRACKPGERCKPLLFENGTHFKECIKASLVGQFDQHALLNKGRLLDSHLERGRSHDDGNGLSFIFSQHFDTL